MKLRIVQTGENRYELEQYSETTNKWISFGNHYYTNYGSAKVDAEKYIKNSKFQKKVIEEL